MQIAICDDDKFFRSILIQKLIEYKTQHRVCIDIIEFKDGISLLDSETVFDMIFLDYQMPGLDGMETAKKLRAKNSLCSIIFVTSYPQFILESFEVQPFRFFIKPLQSDKLYSAINNFIAQQKLLCPIIIVEDGEQKTIESKDIIYLEGDGKYCFIRTNQATFHCSKTLSKAYDRLPRHCFYRIHKSYIVNMYCINVIKGSEVLLTNGEKAAIGRDRISEFKRAYMNFVENYYLRT